jgi:aminopeptidase
MTKYVEVLGAEDPSRFSGVTPAQSQSVVAADRAFTDLRLARPWVITLYPTPGFAALEGLDFDEYTRFLVRASTVDPRPLRVAEERIAPYFLEGRVFRVQTEHPGEKRRLELTTSIAPSLPTMSYGLRNFPDGEVFTSPDANTTEGEIFFDLPVMYGGQDISGIYLQFRAGKIVAYRADVGHEQLATIIETDAGSHRLGEVALGMNPGLDRVLKHPLLVEKVGGTLHCAIGASYENGYVENPGSEAGRARLKELENAGVLNRSAQHVDIVSDFRPGGCGRRVFIDEQELVPKDGVWVPK